LSLRRRVDLTLARPASSSPSASVAPQVPRASRFASSPRADVSRTCTFAGRCHKSVPLNTCPPTSYTHVVHDSSLGTTRRRIRGCFGRIESRFVRSSSLFHPSPIARSVLVYNPRLALAREEDHGIHVALCHLFVCMPAASSHLLHPLRTRLPCCWSHECSSRPGSPRSSLPCSSGSRGALSFPPSRKVSVVWLRSWIKLIETRRGCKIEDGGTQQTRKHFSEMQERCIPFARNLQKKVYVRVNLGSETVLSH
jgi:hypothetical protein